jgi:hypothetical protein
LAAATLYFHTAKLGFGHAGPDAVKIHDKGLMSSKPIHGGECTFFSPSDLITDELRQDRFPMAVRASVDGAPKYLETQRLCGNASSASDPRAERCTLPQSSRQAGG